MNSPRTQATVAPAHSEKPLEADRLWKTQEIWLDSTDSINIHLLRVVNEIQLLDISF